MYCVFFFLFLKCNIRLECLILSKKFGWALTKKYIESLALETPSDILLHLFKQKNIESMFNKTKRKKKFGGT